MKSISKWSSAFLFVLIAVLFFTVLPAEADALSSGSCGPNVSWTLDDEGTLTISGTGRMTDYANYNSAPWYSINSSIKAIVIEDGVTSIGHCAFYGCRNLTSVTIADSVTELGNHSFGYCTGLTSFFIPKTIQTIDGWVFNGCSGLKSITIPDGVTRIEEKLFYGCSSLVDVSIPDSVSYIGNWAFAGCTSLKSIDIPNGVSSILEYTFYMCESLTSFTIPDTVTAIGQYAFEGCYDLVSVSIPDGLKTIGQRAFCGCISLSSLTIPDSVSIIAQEAFVNCRSLTSFVIPNSVTSINRGVFYGCSSLTSVVIPKGVSSIAYEAFYGCSSLTSVSIPDSVTSIARYAFADCTKLKAIHISDIAAWCNISFAHQDANPLYYAHDLYLDGQIVTDLYITDGVASIGDYAFYSCTKLKGVHIPDSVTSIGKFAFSDCSVLNDVIIPDSVTTIGEYAFNNCTGLTYITVPDSVTSIGSHAFSRCSSLENVVIGNSVKRIENSTFYECTKLTNVILGNAVNSIGDSAFAYCTSLNKINIPDGVTDLSAYAFSGCNGLTGIWVTEGNTCYSSDDNGVLFNKDKTQLIKAPAQGLSGHYIIPEGVVVVGNAAFSDCDSLISVAIPGTVTAIKSVAFEYCDGLISVTIPDSVVEIGDNAFRFSTALETVIIPDSVSLIDFQTFAGCSNLKFVSIGNGVTEISENAFQGCSSLSAIDLGSGIVSVGRQAFNFCSKLNHIAYGGTEDQWRNVSIAGSNYALTSPGRIHYETRFEWSKNCVNAGFHCSVCNEFITKENAVDGSHSYTDITDISCNDCDFVQGLTSISIYQMPTQLEYDLFTGVLDVSDGIIQVAYNDGGLVKLEMTLDMVSGFSNIQIGTQTLTVTYEGKSATFDVQIVPGTPVSVSVTTLPNTLSYITGSPLDLTGLVLMAYYPEGLSVEIPATEILVDFVDMATAGVKSVHIGFNGVYTTFKIYVHEKDTVTIDSSLYPQSSHNYAGNTNESKTFTWPGAGSLTLTFHSSSYTESNYDWVYLYDGEGNQIGKYSGNLAGKVVTIPGDSFTVKLTSDSSVNKYGYAFESIVAETLLHAYEYGECTICGEKQYTWIPGDNSWYMQLSMNTEVQLSLDKDLYIDLNGYDLSGTIALNGYKIYGMDSTTNEYACDQMGYFTCVDENGNAIIPQMVVATTEEMTGDVMRYMTIETESGYTFHRFYLGITNLSLAPSVTGFGYKAEIYGDEMVRTQIKSIGYSLWLTEDRMISRTADFKNTLTLRLKNFDAAGYGETPVNAMVTMTLLDGTVIEGAVHTTTLRQAVESVNENYAAYGETQLAAMQDMIANNPVMQSWLVENIYKES